MLPVFKSQMKVLLAQSCPTLVHISMKCQERVFRGNVYSGSLTLAVICRNLWRYINPSACVLSHFSHVRLFAAPWIGYHQTSVRGILQATIVVWIVMLSSRGIFPILLGRPRDPTHTSCFLHWHAYSLLLSHLGSPLTCVHPLKRFKMER